MPTKKSTKSIKADVKSEEPQKMNRIERKLTKFAKYVQKLPLLGYTWPEPIRCECCHVIKLPNLDVLYKVSFIDEVYGEEQKLVFNPICQICADKFKIVTVTITELKNKAFEAVNNIDKTKLVKKITVGRCMKCGNKSDGHVYWSYIQNELPLKLFICKDCLQGQVEFGPSMDDQLAKEEYDDFKAMMRDDDDDDSPK